MKAHICSTQRGSPGSVHKTLCLGRNDCILRLCWVKSPLFIWNKAEAYVDSFAPHHRITKAFLLWSGYTIWTGQEAKVVRRSDQHWKNQIHTTRAFRTSESMGPEAVVFRQREWQRILQTDHLVATKLIIYWQWFGSVGALNSIKSLHSWLNVTKLLIFKLTGLRLAVHGGACQWCIFRWTLLSL